MPLQWSLDRLCWIVVRRRLGPLRHFQLFNEGSHSKICNTVYDDLEQISADNTVANLLQVITSRHDNVNRCPSIMSTPPGPPLWQIILVLSWQRRRLFALTLALPNTRSKTCNTVQTLMDWPPLPPLLVLPPVISFHACNHQPCLASTCAWAIHPVVIPKCRRRHEAGAGCHWACHRTGGLDSLPLWVLKAPDVRRGCGGVNLVPWHCIPGRDFMLVPPKRFDLDTLCGQSWPSGPSGFSLAHEGFVSWCFGMCWMQFGVVMSVSTMTGLDFRALNVWVRIFRLFGVGFDTLTMPRTVEVPGCLDWRWRVETLSTAFSSVVFWSSVSLLGVRDRGSILTRCRSIHHRMTSCHRRVRSANSRRPWMALSFCTIRSEPFTSVTPAFFWQSFNFFFSPSRFFSSRSWWVRW